MTFEITFLGASGGPLEGTTCSILLKPGNITYDDIIANNRTDDLVCIDAGSGLFALTRMIDNPHPEGYNRLLKYYSDALPLEHYCEAQITYPFEGLCENRSPFEVTSSVFHSMNNYLITHPHIDHIASLVINSAAFRPKNPRNVYGSFYTIGALKKHIFNGIIWPDLSKDDMIRLHTRNFWEIFTINSGRYDIQMLDLSHGELHSNVAFPSSHNHVLTNELPKKQVYISSAFLITDTIQNASILVFGDFESDTKSGLSKNKRIWNHIAPMIASKNATLKAIVLECSNYTTTAELYGHLMPMHLILELKELHDICLSINPELDRPLSNIHVIINHVKDTPTSSNDPRRKILSELKELSLKEDLGINFTVALSGVSLLV